MVSPIGLVRNVKHPSAVAVSAVAELLKLGCLEKDRCQTPISDPAAGALP